MKRILRSAFRASAKDNLDLLLSNALAIRQSGLEFLTPEYQNIWEYIDDFVKSHGHVPETESIILHFQRNNESSSADQVEILKTIKPSYRGDFQKLLVHLLDQQKERQVEQILKDANHINKVGMEFQEGRDKRILKGPSDAVRYVSTQSLKITRPSSGIRKEGEVTADTNSFYEDYERRRDDPTYGQGQLIGIRQPDEAIGGARKHQLWTHAAFTGELKCLTAETRIHNFETGEMHTVKELFDTGRRPLVQTLDEKTWTMKPARIGHVVQNEVVPIYKVTTNTGRTIRVSGNHPFRTISGWTLAEDLKSGTDFVAIPQTLETKYSEEWVTDEEVKLVGYILGDGCIVSGNFSFTNTNSEIRSDFIHCLQSLGYTEKGLEDGGPTYRYLEDRFCYRISKDPNNSSLRLLLEVLGLWECDSHTKHIPKQFWSLPKRQIWLLLGTLWATDGSLFTSVYEGKRKTNMYYATVSPELALGVHTLLHKVGIQATVRKHPVIYEGETRHCWQVKIKSNSWERFASQCPIPGKEEQVQEIVAILDKQDYLLPSMLLEEVEEKRWKSRTGSWRYLKWAKKRKTLTLKAVQNLASQIGNQDLALKCNGQVCWELVESVELDGEEMTYDMSVPGPENFVANGFIVHNSTLCFNWIYNQAIYFGYSSLSFCLEMAYDQCQRIIYVMHSMHPKFTDIRIKLGIQQKPDQPKSLNYKFVRDGKLPKNQEKFLRDYVLEDLKDESNSYGKIHFRGYDPDKQKFTVSDIRGKSEALYREDPFSLLIVDHTLLVDSEGYYRSTTEKANEVVRDLKKMAEVFNRGDGMAIVNLFQISREGKKRADKQKGPNKYNLYDLSYSNEIERSSDVVTTSYLNPELRERNMALIQCLKGRDDGIFDPFYVRINWTCRRLMQCDIKPVDEDQIEEFSREVEDIDLDSIF